MVWIVLGVILFIVVGGMIGLSQGGNCGEIGCAYVVVGVMVLIGFYGYRNYQKRQAYRQMVGFKNALIRFHDDCGRYPSTQEGLGVLIRQPGDCRGWKAYVEADQIPRDPWGNEYVYSTSTEKSFRITSGGTKDEETSDDITVEGPSGGE